MTFLLSLLATLAAESTGFNPPDIVGWLMVFLAIALPLIGYMFMSSNK